MNHAVRALIVIPCVQIAHAAEPKEKQARRAARNTAFEHRFSGDLKQTADSEARLDKWFRDAKVGAFIHFGVYYSQAQDWDEPDAPYLNKRAKLSDIHPDLPDDFKPDMDRYIVRKSLPQVEERVKNYELDLIWFDTPVGMNMERVKLFSTMVRKYRPDCLINSRIIHSEKADFVHEGAALKITLPAMPLDEYDTVLKVGFTESIGEQHADTGATNALTE